MRYFAYGSNRSVCRLRERVPSAVALGCHTLEEHDLRFHKSGKDGSGKCDAFFTGDRADIIFGALFEINPSEKPSLDRAEGLGRGYDEKNVTVLASDGSSLEAITYIAIEIDEHLKPYSWYVNHVLVGASETPLPNEYVQRKICPIESFQDIDKDRDARERAVHS
jgi:gamma-glutamylcyclotransferase